VSIRGSVGAQQGLLIVCRELHVCTSFVLAFEFIWKHMHAQMASTAGENAMNVRSHRAERRWKPINDRVNARPSRGLWQHASGTRPRLPTPA
jgi:hypothetical protein